MQKEQRRHMKKISKIIGSVLITAAAVCLGIGVYQFTKEQNAGKVYQDHSEEVKKDYSPYAIKNTFKKSISKIIEKH